MASRIRGIFFDLGDTLLDFGQVDIPTIFESGARLAYDYLKSLGKSLPSFAAYHRRQLWAIRWSYFKSRLTRREFDAADLIARLADRMGHDLTEPQVTELAWLWYEPLSRCATAEPGLQDTLRALADGGRTLGVISNTFIPAAALDRHLEGAGLLDLLPVRVYSCAIRYRKPHPAIFRAALEQAGIGPEEAMFVGDSPQADILGANRVGMISVLKDPAGRHRDCPSQPNHRISHLAELPALVAAYEGR